MKPGKGAYSVSKKMSGLELRKGLMAANPLSLSTVLDYATAEIVNADIRGIAQMGQLLASHFQATRDELVAELLAHSTSKERVEMLLEGLDATYHAHQHWKRSKKIHVTR
jgi:hypothetical protein